MAAGCFSQDIRGSKSHGHQASGDGEVRHGDMIYLRSKNIVEYGAYLISYIYIYVICIYIYNIYVLYIYAYRIIITNHHNSNTYIYIYALDYVT